MKVLMVLTSHDQLGNTGRKTGFWLEELAAPYYVFKDAGVEITLASPKGGRPPLDPKRSASRRGHLVVVRPTNGSSAKQTAIVGRDPVSQARGRRTRSPRTLARRASMRPVAGASSSGG
jgi:putative intracellular protease/amidase